MATKKRYVSRGLAGAAKGGSIPFDSNYQKQLAQVGQAEREVWDKYVYTPEYQAAKAENVKLAAQSRDVEAQIAETSKANAALRTETAATAEGNRLLKEHADSRIAMARKKYGKKFESLMRGKTPRQLSDLARLAR